MMMPVLPSPLKVEPDTLCFRQATVDDAEWLCPFACRLFVDAFAAQNSPDNMAAYVAQAFTVPKIREELADAGNRFIVVSHEQTPIAYYKLKTTFDCNDPSLPACVLERPSIFLERFYVDSGWHGSGVAGLMMLHCLELAQALGREILLLGVWEENLRAQKFYRKWGFQIVGKHPFILGDAVQTDYWMSCPVVLEFVAETPCRIVEVNAEPHYLDAAKALFREYQESRGLPLDFQGFDREIENLPGKFVPPSGALYVVLWDNQPVGCVAFHQLEPDICELKRLFVKPSMQGRSLGRKLMERAMADAKAAGYRLMRLDCLRRFEAAGKLYPKMGFYEIPAYIDNPYPDAYYMERVL
jgi:putative acetyltransferase